MSVSRYCLRAVRNQFNYDPVPGHESGSLSGFVDDAPVSVESSEHFSKYKPQLFEVKNLRELGTLREGAKPITLGVNIPIAFGGNLEHVFEFFGVPPTSESNSEKENQVIVESEKTN